MESYIIYKATNIINNKVYIGFTKNFKQRINQHKSAYQRYVNNKFYNAINKYGWINFKWDIIYSSTNKEECLNMIEPFFIILYNSIDEGYNTTKGGECNPLFGTNNGMYGKTHSIKVKQKLSSLATDRFKGKSYIDLYGNEKARQLKELRSNKSSTKDNKGNKNPRFDPNIYTFYNHKTTDRVMLTRFDFMTQFNLNRTTVHEIMKGCKRKNWSLYTPQQHNILIQSAC